MIKQPEHAPATAGPVPAGSARLAEILRNPRLPSPPAFALQVFQKAGQDDCTLRDLSELLAHDPGLCARLLKVLNSAVYGRREPVSNIRQAVSILGTGPLRSLVLGLAVPALQSGMAVDGGLQRFWRRSVAGAVMARELAARARMPVPDDEMAVALLRDLGMLLLRHAFPEAYAPLWSGGGAGVADPCAWEQEHLGVDHARVSAALLDEWRLPREIVEPIRFHHAPDQFPWDVPAVARRVLLLNFVTRLAELEEAPGDPDMRRQLLDDASMDYGLGRRELEELLGSVRRKVEELSAAMGVDVGDCPDFVELLVTRCDELVNDSVKRAVGRSTLMADAEATSGSAGPAPPVAAGALAAPGTAILQYEVCGLIGRGAVGVVYKAYDRGLGRYVALKLLSPELAGHEAARRRFALEARYAAGLRHPHVVAIYAVHEWEGTPLLVMEYVNGRSIDDQLKDGRFFSAAEVARIGREIALGLHAAHEARLIHRDIKPANVLLEGAALQARVADFGLARALDADLQMSHPGTLVGTPMYMSPEQVDNRTLTPASDVFSLGSLLYAMAAREPPFLADSLSGVLAAVALEDPPPLCARVRGFPEGLSRVIAHLLAKDPARRPPSAAAVADMLAPWAVDGRAS